MTQEVPSDPKNSPSPAVETAPRVRRVSTPRPKKTAKASAPVASLVAAPPEEVIPESKTDWPEPEAATAGGGDPSQTDSAKRKRRRRKGKGSAISVPSSVPEILPEEIPAAQAVPPQPSPQRVKVDSTITTKMAWKIFLAEVSEEGVALISDNDAKDLSRRCFRLAEIFIEEQSRRR